MPRERVTDELWAAISTGTQATLCSPNCKHFKKKHQPRYRATNNEGRCTALPIPQSVLHSTDLCLAPSKKT